MLALGLLVDLAAYIAVGVGHDKSFPPSIGWYAGGFAVPLPRWPTSPYAASRRTPTRCCCRSSPSSTGSAWCSSTGSTSPTPTAPAS